MAFTISQLKPSPISAAPSTSRLFRSRRTRITPLPCSKSQPSISEIERAIGITSNQNSSSDMSSSLMDLLESTPIGREGPTEKALREAAEKFTDHAEAHTAAVHRFVLELFVKILLPLWLLAVAVASGLVKLPFNAPFIDDLIM